MRSNMLMLQITSLEHKAFVCVNIYEKQAGGSNTKKKCKHCLSCPRRCDQILNTRCCTCRQGFS